MAHQSRRDQKDLSCIGVQGPDLASVVGCVRRRSRRVPAVTTGSVVDAKVRFVGPEMLACGGIQSAQMPVACATLRGCGTIGAGVDDALWLRQVQRSRLAQGPMRCSMRCSRLG